MSEKQNKVFITPDDNGWALPDSERLIAWEQDMSESPYTDDWFIISLESKEIMRLHKDEIEALYKFVFGEQR